MNTAPQTLDLVHPPIKASMPSASGASEQPAPSWHEGFDLLERSVAHTRRLLRPGDTVYQGGQGLSCLYVIHSGAFKTVNFTADGRGQMVGLHFRGSWLGFDGIESGRYACDATALDVGEVWAIRYEALLQAAARLPALMHMIHVAMSGQIARECENLLNLSTLPADARVANFISDWLDAMDGRGLRTDQLRLPMSRAEIGNYLGLTLETVSRAMSRLAERGVIRFDERCRRDISIPSRAGLRALSRCEPGHAAHAGPARWPASVPASCRAS